MNPALDESVAGGIIDGRYRLERVIGRGGMGTVWLARHLQLERSVAVKLLRAGDARATKRFLHEARTAATVRHRHVVDILDFGLVREGEPYMVMEFLEGMTLSERLSASPPLSIAALLEIVDDVLDGLAAIHAAGIVHRDLKQENVFLVQGPGGLSPKVVDFGLSAPAPGSETPLASGVLTLEGEILGTPSYMSPEQVRRLEDVDRRADVYSIGVMLYAALSGRLPFDSPNFMDVLLQIAGDDEAEAMIEARPEVGAQLANVVHRAMSKDRHERFADVESLREALRVAAADESLAELDARPLTRRTRRTSPFTGDQSAIGGLVLSAPEITVLRNPANGQSSRPIPTPRWWWLLAASLAIVVVIVVGSTISGRTADVTRPSGSVETVSSARGGALSIAIVFGALPEGARIRIDGRPVSGPQIRHVKDLREHRVEVDAEGFIAWSGTFVADGDQLIEPRLSRVVVEPPPPVLRPPMTTVEAMQAEVPTPEIFEELDY